MRAHTLTGLGLGFLKLNPEKPVDVIAKILYSVNQHHCKPPLSKKQVTEIINWTWNKKIAGEIDIQSGTKYIVFNDCAGLSIKQKLSMSGKLMGKIRRNRSTEKLKKILNKYQSDNNKTPTQKQLAELAQMSIATIKRYWSIITSESHD